jgi:hypothetical protein
MTGQLLTRGRYAVLVLLVLAACASVSGCDVLKSVVGSSATSTAAPPTPASTSASASASTPSPTSKTTTRGPAPIPSAARPKTKIGAANFVKFFYGQFNRSQTEPNPTLLPPLYLESCKPCAAYTDGAQALADNKQHYADPPFVVGDIVPDSIKGDTATVIVEVAQQAAPVVDAQGTPAATSTPRQVRFFITLTFTDGWKIANIETTK